MAPFPWSLPEIEARTLAGELSAEVVLQAAIDAIESREPSIQAWSHLDLAAARETARKLDPERERTGPRSPLHGVPYALKDIFDTEGMPTEWGTPTQRGRIPADTCALANRLRRLGCVLLGKTRTTAFAYYDTGPTRNPHDPGHTPGGSSSGSAAAVAAGMVPFAVGSQTQGSVLRPASFCGVAGFKPTHGLLPLEGVMPFAPTLDHAGLFAATACDLQPAWRALGFESTAQPAKTVTVMDWPPTDGVEPAMAEAFAVARDSLASSRMSIQRTARPAFFDALPGALHTVMAFEAAREHGNRYRRYGTQVGAKLAELLEEGLGTDQLDYEAALQTLFDARRAFAAWAQQHPVVATPAAPGPAPAGLASSGDPRCNAPFTALGVPAISVPLPVPDGQLPLGLQLTAPRGGDATLLATAETCETLLRNRV